MTEEPKTQWLPVSEPISVGLTTTGELMIEWDLVLATPEGHPLSGIELPRSRLGILLPVATIKILTRYLDTLRTMPETLSAEKPEPGAH